MRNWLRQLRGHLWLIRRVGIISYAQYESVRRERERELQEGFDPKKHGERMLRALGCNDDVIAEARAKGLA